jgi:alpha,alpha-trehalose-phosphate synthase [UDP-forming]
MTARTAPTSPTATAWTKQGLHDLISTYMKGVQFISVSNREPYRHVHSDGRIRVIQPASGLATALDPVMRASGGVWVAQGSGDADREVSGARARIRVPPDDPSYTLRRVWLSRELEDEYYYGLANEGLWPLCHVAFHRPRFSRRNWESYRRANQIFADAVLEEVGSKPAFVFIQDYHFGLLPRMLKTQNPSLNVAQFWHIPWPNRETFRAFPWKEELLDGMLGNDLLGFHLHNHCANFLDTVERHIEAKVNRERAEVTRGGRPTMVRPFPISIDFEWHDSVARGAEVEQEMRTWRKKIGTMPEYLGIGIDRIDYTKGIPERLQAFDLFLENNPRYRGRIAFVQIGVPSRTQIRDYRELNDQITYETNRLNDKWGRRGYTPVRLFIGEYSQTQLIALHRLATFCMVSPLHDGMNLVAKEFVASRFDESGVLILSDFAGAAGELTDALIVNPFSIDEMAEAIHRAITLSAEECRKRMQRLRVATAENNVYRWAGRILLTLLRIDSSEQAESVSSVPSEPWEVAQAGGSF